MSDVETLELPPLEKSQPTNSKEDQKSPESTSFRDHLVDKIKDSLKEKKDVKEALDLDKEKILGLPVQDYIDYLDIIGRADVPELIAKNFDVVIQRFESDIKEFSSKPYPERQFAMNVGQATRYVLHSLAGSQDQVDIKLLDKMYSFINDSDPILSYQASATMDNLVWIDKTGEIYKKFKNDLSTRLVDLNDKNPTVTDNLLDTAWGSFGSGGMNDILRLSLKKSDDDQQVGRVVGAFSDRIGLEETLSLIREYTQQAPELKSKLESAQKVILGERGEAFEDLRDLYEKTHFESYKINEQVNDFEINLLTASTEKSGRVLDIGAGTGRLMKGLKEKGRDVVGFDFTNRHALLIKEEDPSSQILIANWLDMPFQSDSFEAAYSLGRSFSHNTTYRERLKFFREASRVIKEGGSLVIDIPNPEKGYYLENRNKLAQKLEEEGIDYFEDGLIFDSPDGENYFTRLVPDPEQFEAIARLGGFKVEDKVVRELPTGKGDENIYYVLRKTPEKLSMEKTMDLIAKTRTSGPSLRMVVL